ncbi:MAG: S9 family peptidase [Saprospiraceae bacterium]|nr:S9 family peptidase [Saprospiraceae bacterium]
MKKILYFTALLSLFSNATSKGQNFSIADILSMPYCSDLKASPDGLKIAWVANTRGIRSLYTARAPNFTPQLRYQATADDGQQITNIRFDHSGSHLYFVKGSATNREGEIANPASQVVYPVAQLFQVNLASNAKDTMGSYTNYLVAPDDQDLLIMSGKKILSLDFSTRQLTTLLEMRGSVSHVTFNRDGTAITFVSNRNDHSFIGYYQIGDARIKWLAPSIYHDQHPVWSRDGDQIAFIRTPGDGKGTLPNITGGNPFSIMIYDLEKEQVSEVWRSPGDDGGFAQYYNEEPLRWAGDRHLLFYSEHEGWMKIYALDLSDGSVKNLLPGDCEIEHSFLAHEEQVLVFSTNCGDIDRRDLYEFDLKSGLSRQITDGDAIETDPLYLEPNIYAYRKGEVDIPQSIAIRNEGQEQQIFPVSESKAFPVKDHIVPQQVVFHAEDGMEIHGQLFVKDSNSNCPGILFMHGGPIRQMLLGYHYSSYYANAYAFNQYLANSGYVVLSVNYRAGIGYGKSFRRAEGQGPRGASEYQDIVAAGRYLQTQAFVDSTRIGLWGGSYGGLLTAQGLARNPDLFKAGVDFHGVHDWSWRATDFSQGGFWGITEDLMEQAYNASPVAEMNRWKSPVLLIHGDDDRNVMFGQTIDLAQRLEARGVHYEILVLPDEVHGFYRHESWVRSYQAAADFFDRYLQK